MKESELNTTNKLIEMMADFKIEFADFFKGFLTNYTQEISRTSITPLLHDIEKIKDAQNDFLSQTNPIQNQ